MPVAERQQEDRGGVPAPFKAGVVDNWPDTGF
jgi:hypothetical protein